MLIFIKKLVSIKKQCRLILNCLVHLTKLNCSDLPVT